MNTDGIFIELPADNSELSNIGFNKKFDAVIDYEVVGEGENFVTLKINNIMFKKNKKIE